jgi:hypothetical protein
MNRLVPPFKSPRLSVVHGLPFWFRFRSFQAGSGWWLFISGWRFGGIREPALFFVRCSAIDAGFWTLPRSLPHAPRLWSAGGGHAATPVKTARCVVDKLFASGELETLAEPGSRILGDVRSCLPSWELRGLSALALAVAERVKAPMGGRFPRRRFEHLETTRAYSRCSVVVLLMPQPARRGRGSRHARGLKAFPAYYLDNLRCGLQTPETAIVRRRYREAIEAPRVPHPVQLRNVSAGQNRGARKGSA